MVFSPLVYVAETTFSGHRDFSESLHFRSVVVIDNRFPEKSKVSGRTTLINTGCSILFPVIFEP